MTLKNINETKIYRSDLKTGLYIYLAHDKDIEDLPQELSMLLGKHTLVMKLDLNQRQDLANEDINKVKANLEQQGYHVQLPDNIINNVLNYGK